MTRRQSDLEERFLEAAGAAVDAAILAVTASEAGGRDHDVGWGADGAPTGAADRAAETAIVAAMACLDLPIISEEAGPVDGRMPRPDEPWLSVDPLDGSRNHRNGYAGYATAIGLVIEGRAVAGVVADLCSSRRWSAAKGRGAWVDGRPCCTRASDLAIVPSPTPATGAVTVPPGYARVRMVGSTSLELCAVAEGAVGAWVDSSRGVTHPHDLAAPSVILSEAGGALLDMATGRKPHITPEPARTYRLIAAFSASEAQRLHSLFAPV